MTATATCFTEHELPNEDWGADGVQLVNAAGRRHFPDFLTADDGVGHIEEEPLGLIGMVAVATATWRATSAIRISSS